MSNSIACIVYRNGKILIAHTDSVFYHKDKKCTLNAYFVSLEHDGIAVPYRLTEHSEYAWVKPEDIPSDNFVDSDLQIYPEVLKAIKNEKS